MKHFRQRNNWLSQFRHSRQKVQARFAVPFAVELLPEFLVDGTWNVPTTLWTAHGMCLLLCGRHMECAYYFGWTARGMYLNLLLAGLSGCDERLNAQSDKRKAQDCHRPNHAGS